MGSPRADDRSVLARVPAPVTALVRRIHDDGHRAYLVGGCVRDLLRDAPVRDFDVASSAPPARVLELFPHAVPVGVRHGTVMVPRRSGPVDVTRFRAGGGIEDDLARRDFRVNAMALDFADGHLIDPHGGRADLAARRLGCVGRAADRLAEDPVRGLRAARLAATLGFAVEPEVCDALPETAGALTGAARERIASELTLLLRAPRPGPGVALLETSGIAAALLGPTRVELAPVLGNLPASLSLRLFAWLGRGSASDRLTALRFPRAVVTEVEGLARLHPVEQRARADRLTTVRRLLQRAGPERLDALIALRRLELSVAEGAPRTSEARERLEALATALKRIRALGNLPLGRADLALDGRAVMELLGWGPGRRVGEALEYLNECVLEDPTCNDAAALRERLRLWAGRREETDA